MKHLTILLLLLIPIVGFTQTDSTRSLIEIISDSLAQAQLDAYNNRDIEKFLACYTDSVEIYSFPDILISKGKEAMRPSYTGMFENNPDLHCELRNRIVERNVVIDHELVTGLSSGRRIKAIAIYTIGIESGKIQKVHFIQ